MDYITEVINISKIREGFFIGDRTAGTNLDVVIQFKITHMINAAGSQIINQFESIGVKYLTLNWSETPNQKLFDSKDEIANRIVQFIDDSLKIGEGLLAHSVRGQDRVCLVVIIYLMRKYNWSYLKCLQFLQSKKQDIDIPEYFIVQLNEFEMRLNKNNNNQIKKSCDWIDDNIQDPEEKLMRNTYINGLPSKKIINNNNHVKKSKKRNVGWADNNPYGKSDYLITFNLQKDLLLMKDIKPVYNHTKMRPSKSCIKNRSQSANQSQINKSYVFPSNTQENFMMNNLNTVKLNNNNSELNKNFNENATTDFSNFGFNNILNNVNNNNNNNKILMEQMGLSAENFKNLTLNKTQNMNNNNNNKLLNNNKTQINKNTQINENSVKFKNNNLNNNNNQKRVNNFMENNKVQFRSNNFDNNNNMINFQGNLNLKDFINVNNLNENDNNYKNYLLGKEQEFINNNFIPEEFYNVNNPKNKQIKNINNNNNNKLEFDFIQSTAGINITNNQLNNLIRNKPNLQNMNNNNNKVNNNFINNNNINNSLKIANRNYKVIDYNNNNNPGMIPKNNAFAFNNKNRGNLNPSKNQCKILFI